MSNFHLIAQGIDVVPLQLALHRDCDVDLDVLRRPSAREAVDILQSSGGMTSSGEAGQSPLTESDFAAAMSGGAFEALAHGSDALVLFERRGQIRWEIHVAAVRSCRGARLVRVISAAMRRMRRDMGAKKFVAMIPASNRPAAHLAIACGYRREGVLESAHSGPRGAESLVVFGRTED